MFGNLFNKSSAKPEERRIPAFAELAAARASSYTSWVMGPLFQYNQDKNSRMYYGGRFHGDEAGGSWDVTRYAYSLKGKSLQQEFSSRFDTLEETIDYIAGRTFFEPYPRVPGIEGNLRELAPLCGGYIDDKGAFHSVKGDKPAQNEALISREQLKAMYAKPKEEKSKEKSIATWDDFYSEVVNKISPLALPSGSWVTALQSVRKFEKKLMDDKVSLSEKQHDISKMEAFWGKDLMADPMNYQYNVMILTALVRAGGDACSKFSTSVSVSPDTLQLLSVLGDAIDNFAQGAMGFSPERAKQLSNLIMQGPDPYAGEPLPLEILLMKKSAPPAPKNAL